MIENKENMILNKFLIALGFQSNEPSNKKILLWKHTSKSIIFEQNLNFNNEQKINSLVQKFLALVKDNFSSQELENLLSPFLKENKIRFYKKSKVSILKIEANCETELEARIINYLLPKKAKKNYLEYSTPIEFSEKLKSKIKNTFVKNLDKEINSNLKIKK